MKSLPERGAWIEIMTTRNFSNVMPCRFLNGERGLKYAGRQPGGQH